VGALVEAGSSTVRSGPLQFDTEDGAFRLVVLDPDLPAVRLGEVVDEVEAEAAPGALQSFLPTAEHFAFARVRDSRAVVGDANDDRLLVRRDVDVDPHVGFVVVEDGVSRRFPNTDERTEVARTETAGRSSSPWTSISAER